MIRIPSRRRKIPFARSTTFLLSLSALAWIFVVASLDRVSWVDSFAPRLPPSNTKIVSKRHGGGTQRKRTPPQHSQQQEQSRRQKGHALRAGEVMGETTVDASLRNDTIYPNTKATTNTIDERIAAILEFVDGRILPLSSSATTESILERIRSQHERDFRTAEASCLEIEDRSTVSSLSYEEIPHPCRSQPSSLTEREFLPGFLAIRSTEPVLDSSAVEAVREAAESIWYANADPNSSSSTTSRFTYQYSGNSEAHVFDFVQGAPSVGTKAVGALNEALQTKLYPTIRNIFFHDTTRTDDGSRLFVYDALVIRYNSTAAMEAVVQTHKEGLAATKVSAGQPLHRDLGLVSVNIMLNANTEFEGGGTFFENQLTGPFREAEAGAPLKPLGVGYCLAHSASERHAGAGTTKGVRDILVLFVSAAASVNETMIRVPSELSSLLLKNCRAICEKEAGSPRDKTDESSSPSNELEVQGSILLCRILHQRLAVRPKDCSPSSSCGNLLVGESLLESNESFYDGEALQYLGTALMEYADWWTFRNTNYDDDDDHRAEILDTALDCFRVASLLTPCDSRVYNNMGIVLGKIRELMPTTEDDEGRKMEQEIAFRNGLDILKRSMDAGCTNDSLHRDFHGMSLNYGLFVANQDRFQDAAAILEPIVADGESDHRGIVNGASDAHRLWQYCKTQCT